jgi:hypothetical protein
MFVSNMTSSYKSKTDLDTPNVTTMLSAESPFLIHDLFINEPLGWRVELSSTMLIGGSCGKEVEYRIW